MLAPVILKNDYNYSAFRNFGALLRKESNSSTLLVISSDFSHNTSKKFAKEQDEESLSVLKDLPNSDFDKLNNDCRACIALLAGFLDHTEYSFQLTENKDSTDFGGEDSNVTSYVSGYFTQNEGLLDETPVTMLFGGDMQFDRYIRSVTTKRGGAFVFDGLRSELQKADLVVTNLEGPITDSTSVSETSTEGSHDNYVFTFPPETAALLKRENIRLVNIGNNHILNFREDGVRQTQGSLEAAGVESFGSPLEGDTRYVIRDIRGTRIAFVNYNQFVSRGRKKALEDIAAVKERSDFLVVYTHWGKEYVEATPEMKELAHTFVDAGADLIIGSHPHVVQESEIYRGKAIYYSLGNLIFDQYFRPETQTGFLVRATFDLADKEITTEAVPIFLRSIGQTEIAPSDLK
jgi:poly-gamma-glutamate synthesis protein (capsule biosynthesis protein)